MKTQGRFLAGSAGFLATGAAVFAMAAPLPASPDAYRNDQRDDPKSQYFLPVGHAHVPSW